MAFIELEGLTFTYSGSEFPSLKDVNFHAERGEFIIITGPSGCGKTTLCRCLNGLIPHFYPGKLEGDLKVAGLEVINHQTRELARHVGLVFQNPENQLFSLTVERDIAFGPENLGVAREDTRKRVKKILKKLDIEELRDRAPYELSGGQQQKVAIAAVLTMQPDIIVLDEPTSFLDPMSSVEILGIINQLHEELNLTVILVEHRLDLASKYADTVLVLDKGRIVFSGPPNKIYTKKTQLLGIGIPKITLLFQLLKKEDLMIKANPVTIEEAHTVIKRMICK